MIRRLLATSGGFVPGPVQRSYRVGDMVLEALALTGKTRPRVCLVETASGDDSAFYAALYEAFNVAGCDVTDLRLFPQPSGDPEERLSGSDLVWVGGGSVANLLVLWRLHGVDLAMRDAWEAGTILAGVSAGSLCWHQGGTTDSYGPTLRPVTNGLALVPYANGVHYNSEAQRRPLLHQLISEGVLGPLAFATDDHVGILYENDQPARVVSDFPVDPHSGPGAYRVELTAEGVVETRWPVGTVLN
ncbi:MAG: peptidase E [Acidimicrobiaceae bacterium]|nr:peptidase E [Acidimicrobiaceae bacterium]